MEDIIQLANGQHVGKVKRGDIIYSLDPQFPIGLFHLERSLDYCALLVLCSEKLPGTDLRTGVFRALYYIPGNDFLLRKYGSRALKCFVKSLLGEPIYFPELGEGIRIVHVGRNVVFGEISP